MIENPGRRPPLWRLVIGLDVRSSRKAANAAGRSEMTGSEPRFARVRRPALSAATSLLVAAGEPLRWARIRARIRRADTIIARKTVMDTLSSKMDTLEAATASTKKIDLAAASEQADTVSVLLMAFPHMFPAATNQWKPNVDKDPGTDTFAAPEVWTKYADFYKQATAASKLAFDASRATQEAEFRTTMTQLRAACDSCHAVYLKAD
jgi:cytochrome c556